ncbi:MAG: hypothetical protein KDA22_10475, partial [Phycisphaerales bacterium]|nr:hypothetical protein [Phycisphaerales bacterium]
MGRPSAIWLGVGLAVLVLAGGGYRYLAGSSALSGQDAKAATGPGPAAVAVEAELVSIGEVIDDIRAVGTLRPNEAVAVSPEIAGRIAELRFDEGDEVAE